MDEPEQFIDFLAKYKNWVSIRRQALDESTKPEEVSLILAMIRNTIESKYYSLIIDTPKLDAYATKLVSGAKGYSAAGAALAQMESPEARREIIAACPDKRLKRIAESYLASRVIERAGVKTSIDIKEMLKVYPELKAYKPKMPKSGGKDDEPDDEKENAAAD
jgi:hypothetical protein